MTKVERLVDSYSESNKDGNFNIGSGTYSACAQSFTCSQQAWLSSCKFYLSRFGSLSGDMTAVLYAHSSTYGSTGVPTGAALATSTGVDSNTVSGSPSFSFKTFYFEDGYSLDPGSNYCISLEWDNGDATHYLGSAIDSSSPTHSGNASAYRVDTSAWNWSSSDMVFSVYGYPMIKELGGVAQASLNKLIGVSSASADWIIDNINEPL